MSISTLDNIIISNKYVSFNKTLHNIKRLTTDDECFVSNDFSVLKNMLMFGSLVKFINISIQN